MWAQPIAMSMYSWCMILTTLKSFCKGLYVTDGIGFEERLLRGAGTSVVSTLDMYSANNALLLLLGEVALIVFAASHHYPKTVHSSKI